MKITHVLPAFTKGGAEQVVVTLANEAVRAGHEVSVVAAFPVNPEWMQDKLLSEVDVRFVAGPDGARLARYLAMPSWLARNWVWLRDQDILHCHLTFGAMVGSAVRLVRRLTRRPKPRVVETSHAVGMPIKGWQRLLLASHARYRDGYALMAEDDYWRGFRARHRDIPIAVIPNGLGTMPVRPSEQACAAFRRSMNIPAEATVVGTVGRMATERKPADLLAAFAELARFAPDAHLLMGGSGPMVEPLRAEAERLGLADRVHLPGLIERPELAMSVMDLYLSVNVGPITGIAGMEAAALGVPVVALQTIATHRLTGADWIWSSSEPPALGAEAARLLQSPGERADMAERQRAHVSMHHDSRGMAQSYFALYAAAGA